MVQDRPYPTLVSILLTVASVIALNALLSVYLWLPSGAARTIFVPIPETLSVVWLCVALTRIRQTTRLSNVAIVIGGIFVGILLSFSLTEGFFRFYFGRPFFPRSDIPMVRGGLLLLMGDIGRVADVLTPVTIVLILAVVSSFGSGLVWAVTFTIRQVRRPVVTMLIITAASGALLLTTGVPSSLAAKTVAWLSPGEKEFVEIDLEPLLPAEDTNGTYVLPGIFDRDVYFFAVEAYGYTTVSRPELSLQLEPARQRLRDALAGAGYEVVTSYLESPVAGGYSWLAEATFFTGQWINTQEKFLELYEADLPTLTGLLHERGYYTLSVRPGTIHGEWPEGWDFYRFEESLTSYNRDFGFEGPWFSYVPVTDQYALWTGENRIRELTEVDGAAAGKPLLVHYQLVSSHTPFNRIPPLIDDWDALGNGEIYNRRASEIQRFDNTWTGGSELDEGFVAAQTYVFDVLSAYVEKVMDHSRSPLIIVFGDHQPQPPIRDRSAVHSVPIHVAARDREITERFIRAGFERGMVAKTEPPHPRMDRFFPTFAGIALDHSAVSLNTTTW